MNWDYIIVHETGHEYWGNALSTEDNGELWIHESFTTYMEALYVEYHYGYEESVRYLQTQRNHGNISPIIGPLNVNWDSYPNSDHYFKGSWFLHTLRSMLNNDELFFRILKTFYDNHKYKTTNSEEFFNTFNHLAGDDYSFMFDQYLKNAHIPILEYTLSEEGPHLKIKYRWKADVKNFTMPVKVGKKGNYEIINPTNKRWKTSLLKNVNIREFQVARELFLIDTLLIK
jgi:aminopeptidase N